MSKRNKSQDSRDEDSLSFRAIGIVFSAAGLGMLFSESTRATGIPFLVLGLTFLALGQQKPTDRPKK